MYHIGSGFFSQQNREWAQVTTVTGNKFYYYEIDPLGESIRNEKIRRIDRAKKIPVKKKPKKKGKRKSASPPAPVKKQATPGYPSVETMLVPLSYYRRSRSLPVDDLFAETELYLIPGVIECGYGQVIKWTSETIIKNKSLNDDMVSYSINRVRLATSCITRTINKEYKVKPFFRFIEPAEKADVSFIIGGIFSYLTALNWMHYHHEKLKYLLHANLLTSASLNIIQTFKTRSMPDYLAHTESGNWHVFESKGGTIYDRWPRVAEGLKQLGMVKAVVWKNGTPRAVSSAVCTHASMDAGRVIETTVVDPENDISHTIKLDSSVVILANAIISLDIYKHFSDDKPGIKTDGADGWIFARSSVFTGLGVAIPEALISREEDIRSRLGIYLAVKETVEYFNPRRTMQIFRTLDRRCYEKIIGSRHARALFHRLKIGDVFYHRDFSVLSETARRLSLDEMSSEIDGVRENLIRSLPDNVIKYLTPAGTLSGPQIWNGTLWESIRRGDRPDPVL